MLNIKHKIARARWYNRKLAGDSYPAKYSPPRSTVFDKIGVVPKRRRL